MKEQFQIFKKYLDQFKEEVLNHLGYKVEELGMVDKKDLKMSNHFLIPQKGLQLHLNISDFEDGRFYLQMSMFTDKIGMKGQYQTFFLDKYIEKHEIKDFSSLCLPKEDFESFARKYFANLKNAFQTYLRDQVTGVSFEEHDPMPWN